MLLVLGTVKSSSVSYRRLAMSLEAPAPNSSVALFNSTTLATNEANLVSDLVNWS